MNLLNLIHFTNCMELIKNNTNNGNISNFSNMFDSYNNIIFQYVNYNYFYLHIGDDINISYILYMFYSSFIWAIILTSFITFNNNNNYIIANKYILIDVFNICGALFGFILYSSYIYINLNIISGIIINVLYLILRRYNILTTHIINYMVYTSLATSSIVVGSFILKNHISHHITLGNLKIFD